MCTYDLKYNDYMTNMSSGLSSLLATADIADMTLAVEGKFFKTHQVILSIFSPYFRELFATSPCKHPIFFMKDVKYQVMKDLLTFMYEGKVQIIESEFNDFVETAKALKVKGLTNMAEPEHIKQPNCEAIENNVLKRFHDNENTDENEVKVIPMAKKNKAMSMPPVPLLSEVSVLPVSTPSTTRNVDQKKAYICSEHIEVQNFCEIQMKEEQHSFIEENKQQVELHLDPDDNSLQYNAEGTIELDVDDDESFDLLEPVANMIDVPMTEPEGEPVIVTYIQTGRGKTIIADGFKYNSDAGNHLYWTTWRCSRRRDSCRAGLCISNDNHIVFKNKHNHEKTLYSNVSGTVTDQRLCRPTSMNNLITWRNVLLSSKRNNVAK